MGRRSTRHHSSALTLVPGDAPAPPPFPPPDDAGDLFVVLLDSAPDAAVVADASGRMVLVNSQTERLFGYRREELVGQLVEVLVPVRFRNGHVGLRNGFLGGSAAHMSSLAGELTGMRRDGSEFPVDISVSVIETSSEPSPWRSSATSPPATRARTGSAPARPASGPSSIRRPTPP